MKVLVVDDNILDRKLISCLITSQFNYTVVNAKHGIDALQKLKEEAFDLMITDLIMPKMEGIELINRTKILYPKMKIIAVSGSNPYYLYIVQKLGITDIFTKPLDIDKFLAVVCNIHDAKSTYIKNANHHL